MSINHFKKENSASLKNLESEKKPQKITIELQLIVKNLRHQLEETKKLEKKIEHL